MDDKKAQMRKKYKTEKRPKVTLLQWMGLVVILGIILVVVHHFVA